MMMMWVFISRYCRMTDVNTTVALLDALHIQYPPSVALLEALHIPYLPSLSGYILHWMFFWGILTLILGVILKKLRK